jgi:hypothetical protein
MFDPPKWAAPFLAAIFNGEGCRHHIFLVAH